jgi:signal transduction histidine kinase/DNA-binding response OmpR family regulator
MAAAPGLVLVVDDDIGMRETLVDIFEAAGIPAAGAGSAAQALELCAALKPAAAVVDQHLPDLTGLELGSQLKAADPDMPVLLLTGHANLESAIAAVGQLDDYLTKPVPPDELVRRVRSHLERRTLRRENRVLFRRVQEANRSLEASVAERTVELNALVAMAEGAARSNSLDQLLRTAVETTQRISGTEVAALYLAGEEYRAALKLRAAEGDSWLPPPELPRPTHAVESIVTGDPERLCDVARLQAGNRQLGALVLCGKRALSPTFLGTLSAQLSVAIQNAQSLERERDTVDRLSELSRMKSAFLATVSHELRTPLTSIVGFAQTLESMDDKISPEDRHHLLERMVYQGQRLARLIEDMLDATRIEYGSMRVEPRPVMVRPVIDRALDLYRDDAHEFLIDVPDDLPAVSADEDRLEQVLVNLIHNAVKYSPNDAPITLGARIDDDQVSVSVTDQGKGIDRAFLPHLFEPFTQVDTADTRRNHGLGLGLYIARGLIEAVGGQITVEAPQSGGTVFIIWLQVAPKQEEALLA